MNINEIAQSMLFFASAGPVGVHISTSTVVLCSYIGMGQAQNGHLYRRYRSSSMKNEANKMQLAYELHPLAILLLNLLYKFR